MKVERTPVRRACTGTELGHGPADEAVCCWWHVIGGLCINAECPEPENERPRVSNNFSALAAGILLVTLVGGIATVAIAVVWRLVRWIAG